MTHESTPFRLKLPAQLDRRAAHDLKAELERNRGVPIRLDASETIALSGLGLQLLGAAAAQWSREDLPFEVADATREVSSLLKLMTPPIALSPGDLEQ
jgi:anti-anti-sigma regulatory factor